MSATPDRVDDSVLDDLRNRLRATRTVTLAGPAGWERGTDAGYLAELVAYWRDGVRLAGPRGPAARPPLGRRRRERQSRYAGGAAARRRADRGPAARLARLVPPVRQGAAAAHRPRRRRAVPARLPVVPADRAARHVDARHGRPRGRRAGRAGDRALRRLRRRHRQLGRGAPRRVPRRRRVRPPPHRRPLLAPVRRRPERPHPARARLPGRRPDLADGRGRLRPRTGDQAAYPRCRPSATRRSGCSPGSSRSCGPGATPAATSSRSTPATSCSPG